MKSFNADVTRNDFKDDFLRSQGCRISYSGQGVQFVIKRAHLFTKGHVKKMKMRFETYDVI